MLRTIQSSAVAAMTPFVHHRFAAAGPHEHAVRARLHAAPAVAPREAPGRARSPLAPCLAGQPGIRRPAAAPAAA